MAFKEIISKEPSRYTDLCEATNKAFEEISDSISVEEFKEILGDLSFLKNKKNVTNLLFTLKTQFSNHMSKYFEQIIEEENLSELFTKKNSLNEEMIEKYLIDNNSLELIELEESLRKLDIQIAESEKTNEVLFNQESFNEQRLEQLSQRLTKLINECQTKYVNCVQQTDILRKEFTGEFTNMLKD